MRMPVSCRPWICAVVSTPVWCRAALLVEDLALRLANHSATRTSAIVISSPAQSIHEVLLCHIELTSGPKEPSRLGSMK